MWVGVEVFRRFELGFGLGFGVGVMVLFGLVWLLLLFVLLVGMVWVSFYFCLG